MASTSILKNSELYMLLQTFLLEYYVAYGKEALNDYKPKDAKAEKKHNLGKKLQVITSASLRSQMLAIKKTICK